MKISLDLLTGGIKLVGEPGVGNFVLQCNTSLPINNFCANRKDPFIIFKCQLSRSSATSFVTVWYEARRGMYTCTVYIYSNYFTVNRGLWLRATASACQITKVKHLAGGGV